MLTGGGVPAGIDFALTVLAEIAAQTPQLGLEYASEPPFIAGRPESVPPNILAVYRDRIAPVLAQTVLKLWMMIGPVAMIPAAGQSGLRFTLRARSVWEG